MKKNFFLGFLLLICIQSSYAQDEFFLTWYKINDGGGASRERVTISADSLVTERLQDYQVDTPYWQIDKVSVVAEFLKHENGIQLIGFEASKNSYTGGELFYGNGKDQVLFFQLRDFHPEVDSIYKLIKTNKYKQLLARPYYTESKAKEIEKYPSMDSISKEEMITLFSYLSSLEPLVDNFLADNEAVRSARMFAIRGLETLRDHKLIELGFNPYKITETYYGNRFKNDPDLMEMNEKSTYMKLF